MTKKQLTEIPNPSQMVKITPRTVVNNTVPIDDHVDRVFGEPVVLKPMRKESGGYREAVPDESRPQVVAVGIFDQTRGAVEGTAGSMTHMQATVDTSLSIRVEPIEQCGLKKGDYVWFPERRELHEVTFIHAEPGGRIHAFM